MINERHHIRQNLTVSATSPQAALAAVRPCPDIGA
jgi:hypothetical protein